MDTLTIPRHTTATPTANLGIVELLTLRGFDSSIPTRIVRHQDDRYPVEDLLRHGWYEDYQAYQRNDVFRDVRQIVSLYGLPGRRAAFHGVYRVAGVEAAAAAPVRVDCPWSKQWQASSKYHYRLERDARFDVFRDRVIVDWGNAARSWVQTITKDKYVLEILAPGRTLAPFKDYLEFSLSFEQLQNLFAHEEAHREWRSRLSAVGGIYLILAETTGALYVGSASGEAGIWGRWREYAATGHGGNVMLKELIDENPSYPACFRYSVLQILPKTMAREEVISREGIYKEKLGSRAQGLNLN